MKGPKQILIINNLSALIVSNIICKNKMLSNIASIFLSPIYVDWKRVDEIIPSVMHTYYMITDVAEIYFLVGKLILLQNCLSVVLESSVSVCAFEKNLTTKCWITFASTWICYYEII